MAALALVFVFFVSGFAALLYQIIWQRMLSFFGGADEDYDVIKHTATTVVSGDPTAASFAAMLNLAHQDMTVPANYNALAQKVDIDGLITGWHDPHASHLLLVEAVAGPALTQRAYDDAVAAGYLWHEFGDSALLLP